jgi:hypothetical protein
LNEKSRSAARFASAVADEGTHKMNMMTAIRPEVGEPLIPYVSRPVVDRLQALLVAIDALIDTSAGRRYPILAGCAVMPFARFVMTGTSCRRPLLLPELQLIAEHTGLDAGLLRFDADRGVTFDFVLEGEQRHCGYVAWRRRGSDPWFIPTAGEGAFIRAGACGLECVDAPPFVSAAEREAGIIRAIESSSFAGRI